MGENLSPRLGYMLGQGIDGEDFWDICCDHGYLGEAAVAVARFNRVLFVDRVPHIISRLRERLGADEQRCFIAARAEDIGEPLTGTVVIAGVGGYNLIKILEEWSVRDILRARRLVLNPITHVKPLREFLAAWPPYVESETILVQEKSRERQILVLERRAE